MAAPFLAGRAGLFDVGHAAAELRAEREWEVGAEQQAVGAKRLAGAAESGLGACGWGRASR